MRIRTSRIIQAKCDRPCWIQTVLILLALTVLLVWAIIGPVKPDVIAPVEVYNEAGQIIP